jgi:WD40 repeat protein
VLSPDAGVVADPGTERLVEVATGRAVAMKHASADPGWRRDRDVAWSADSRFVARSVSGSSLDNAGLTSVEVVDARTGDVADWFVCSSRCGFAWSGRGARLLVGESASRVWDGSTKAHWILPFRAHTTVAIDEDGRRVAYGSGDGVVAVLSVEDGAPAHAFSETHALQVTSLAWRADRVASAGRDGTVRLFDAATMTQVDAWSGVGGWPGPVTISADGDTVAVVEEEGVRILRVGRPGFFLVTPFRTASDVLSLLRDERGRLDGPAAAFPFVRVRLDDGGGADILTVDEAERRGVPIRAPLAASLLTP